MAATPATTPALEAALARQRFRRVTAQVFAVQIATLVVLWLLHAVYGKP